MGFTQSEVEVLFDKIEGTLLELNTLLPLSIERLSPIDRASLAYRIQNFSMASKELIYYIYNHTDKTIED